MKKDEPKWPGLTEEEAAAKLDADGFNELPSQKQQSIFALLFRILTEPMMLLLLGSGLVYVLVGEIKDALMLLSFVFVVIGISFYQERKTDKTLTALRNLASPRALVVRGGERKRIPGREVVKGDILVLREGDRVPADAVILSCSNLLADESLLTGESLPVRKCLWDGTTKQARPGGDDLSFVYSGSLIVSGQGIAQVTGIGLETEIGKIGKRLETIKEEETLLAKETRKIVRYFTLGGGILCAIVVILYTLIRQDLLGGFLAGLTLSMAILPEEFPVVLIIFLTLGAWRISKRQVLTRRPAAIETLGSATTLCVDKTGTLTLNKMRLASLYAKNTVFSITEETVHILPEEVHELIEYSVLASQKDPFDPIEKAIKSVSKDYRGATEHLHENWKLVGEYPLSPKLLALSHVWESPDQRRFVIAAKGAPETIADLCHLNKTQKDKLMNRVYEMANSGLRVLGVAKARFNKSRLPLEQHNFDFEIVGLLGFSDPVRAAVAGALKEAYRAGIRVIMITGDYPGTAISVAQQIGLTNPSTCITGAELDRLDHLELREKIKTINIFARVIPEQKLAIVNALKANGEIVAMTGDGVNDAPALKSANIGIAMGERGTDVAREAASLVLLNDDFSSIVTAVKLGRRIFDNLRKAMSYIFAIHIPIAGMSLLPLLFNLPPVLLPAHIAFLELIIDPACSLVFESEPEEKNIMERPPRNLRDPLFDQHTVWASLLQGLSVLGVVFGFFFWVLTINQSESKARSLAYAVLVFANLILIVANLSWSRSLWQVIRHPNKALFWVITGAVAGLLIIFYVPFLRSLFHFSYLNLADLALALGAGLVSLALIEVVKFINLRWFNKA